MNEILDVHEYTPLDQEGFAALSCDFNPVHIDPLAARRALFGDTVVHGMHTLLRALDAWHGQRRAGEAGPLAPTRLVVRFPNPIHLGQRIETRLREADSGHVRLEACHGSRLVLRADLHFGTGPPPPDREIASAPREPDESPLDLTIDEIEGRAGALPVFADRERLTAAFPRLAESQSVGTTAELLALTRLVGMRCPGLHSLFSGFDVEFQPPEEGGDLEWKVELVDDRVSLVRLQVEGPTLRGRLETFRRPQPQSQPGIGEVRARVGAEEFREQVALVIGGSRGLGEVTARIVAAGGGHPVVTYYRGLREATGLVSEIRSAGFACDAIACDVAAPDAAVAAFGEMNLQPTHLYYFASPRIFVNKGEEWEPSLFQSFVASYVTHFHDTLRAVQRELSGSLTVFYPSSTALTEPVSTLAEYAAAKAAGEELCRYLDRFEKALRIDVRRLPRIATDQTLTLVPVPAEDALEVMLEIVRDLAT